jgi:hypothetical protein
MLILRYLIPTHLNRGVLPSPALFKKFPSLRVYQGFVDAVNHGNLQLFDSEFTRHQTVLIKWGTWLVIERVRLLVLRQLFRKIWSIMEKPSRVGIEVFKRGIELSMNSSVDTDHVHCLVVNLIDRSYLKGYISYEKNTVVLSNRDPFPKIK